MPHPVASPRSLLPLCHALALLLALAPSVAFAQDGQQWAIRAQMGQALGELLATGTPLADGSRITAARIEKDRVVVDIVPPDGPALQFTLLPPAPHGPTDGLRHFAVDGPAGAPRAALAARLAGGDDHSLWSRVDAQLPGEPSGTSAAALHALAQLQVVAEPEQLRRQTDAVLAQIPRDTAPVDIAWAMARLLWQQGRREIAKTWLQRVIAATDGLDPNQAATAALGARLGALDLAGRAAQADQVLTQCLAAGRPAVACGVRDRSEAAGMQGDWLAAARWYDQALGDGSSAALPELAQRAAVAMRAGDGKGELQWAKRAIDRFANDPEALDLWATANFRAGQFELAVQTYETLFHRDPARPSVLAHLSGAFNRMHGEVASADQRAAFERLRVQFAERARDPRDVVARFLGAVAVFYDADFDAAIDQMRALEPLLPAEPRISIYLAMAHYWQGDVPAAQRYAQDALRKGPHDPDVYYCLSKVIQDQDPKAAIGHLQHYVALAEAPGAIHFADKTARIREEIKYLQRGERPPDWDRPAFGAQHKIAVAVAAGGLALLVGLVVLWRRRRGRR